MSKVWLIENGEYEQRRSFGVADSVQACANAISHFYQDSVPVNVRIQHEKDCCTITISVLSIANDPQSPRIDVSYTCTQFDVLTATI